MEMGGASKSATYRDYWLAAGRELSTHQLRTTSYFILILQGVFVVLDRFSFPDHFLVFLAMRMAVNLVVLGVLLGPIQFNEQETGAELAWSETVTVWSDDATVPLLAVYDSEQE